VDADLAAARPSPDRPLALQYGVVHAVPGRLRLRLTEPRTLERLEEGCAALRRLPGVRGVRANRSAWSLVVEYDPARTDARALLDAPGPPPPPRRRSDGWSHDAVEGQTVVAAPLLQVWRVVAAPERLAALSPVPLRLRRAADRRHWTAELVVRGERVTVRLTVTRRAPERLIVTGEGGLVGWLSVTLRPVGERTWLRERLHYTAGPGGLAGWLAGRLVTRPVLDEHVRRHLAAVKAEAERQRSRGR
jgi:carbon monoxide dehydrogenase subunit G